MKKRFTALLLVLAMLLSAVPSALAEESGFTRSRSYTDGQFTDVLSTDWFSGDVKNAYELGLMQGTGNQAFSPNGTVTLAETIAVAARIHAIASLSDVSFTQGTPWYQVYVDYALTNGILTAALSDYTRAATRLEFAQILAKALPESALACVNTIADGAIPDVADDASVYLLYRAGVLTGSDAVGTFHPDSSIRRSEMAAIVARMADPALRKSLTLGTTVSSSEEASDSDDTAVSTPVLPDVSEEESDESTVLTQPFDLENPELFASGEVSYSGEQILIKFTSGYSGALSAGLSAAGITALEPLMSVSSGEWYIGYTSGDVTEVMPKVRALSEVLLAEYDYVYETSDTILDADCVREECKGNVEGYDAWHLLTAQLQDAWDYLSRLEGYTGHFGGSSSVVVAVIDTGVDYTHEDLKDNIWCNTAEIPDNGIDDDKNGYVDDYYGVNLETGRGSGMDDNGHGTHVAGIIAGANNNLGILGVAPYVRIMPIKAGMASGYFNQSQIAKAVIYAFENGADVINMSFGGSAVTIAVQEALEAAYSRCVLVASAGNDGAPNEVTDHYSAAPTYPAALPYVLGVMSVDRYGREASYSNWDTTAYNSVEYEVYAPGTDILSTLPGNRYASWSGTSMAAPYVSAVAALVRSAYPDRDQYPTKFIYGQIASTGTRSAICCDPEAHTVEGETHNLPKIVNVYRALTDLPKPDVNISDYTLFDLAKYGEENNGDGVIDAGETIALGFTLRNRWGKADDAVVTVSCSSPYVSFENASISYGSVGTYSTQDCGLVKEGEYVTDLENPFLMHVSKDCPNDYILALTVTVTYKNGLDTNDTVTYSSKTTIDLDVRRGVILPDLISEDMTLTAENYYILPNATEIAAGATVTVEAGTQIQFWSDDPNDPYADTYIAYLMVRGTLLFEGTEDERIRLFPSERMSDYIVQIYEVDDGYISMKYTDVVNGVLDRDCRASNEGTRGISYACGCEFTQNYNNSKLFCRYLTGSGSVSYINTTTIFSISRAESCAFYRLGVRTTSSVDEAHVYGHFYNCVFADSGVILDTSSYRTFNSFEGCLFYGNYLPLSPNDCNSSYVAFRLPADITRVESIAPSTADTTAITFVTPNSLVYASKYSGEYEEVLNRFAAHLGGTVSSVTFFYDSGSSSLRVVMELPDGDTEWTEATLLAAWDTFCDKGYNTNFYHNAILNRFTDTNVEHWLRVQAPEGSSENVYGLGGNYWGTSGMSEKRAEEVIGLQIVDNRDYKTLARLNEGEVLDEVPEDVWPCVTNAGLLNADGESVTTVGNETLTFFVEFNRDMDTSVPLTVSFGSSEPYADYTVSGEYVSARRWEGKMTLNTLVESGTQYWSISNGRSSEGHWKLYRDWGRFTFVIDTASALAMIMQGSGEDDGVHLSWFQDEFETLAGYNVYRATSENGQYSRLNTNLIPVGTEEWVDTGVLPGEVYYYNFEVVKTDLSTSYTSPKISVQAKDTMAPSLYHEPVYSAFTGSNLVLSATATDNVAIASVSVFYRAVGETDFREMRMENLNDRYSAIIGANFLTTDGLEYYIRAFDGINYTYKGSAAEPFTVTISEAIDANALGDVDGNGQISVLDALLILQQLNGLYNMTPEEFARADLDGDGNVSAAEALRIVQYANGMIGSVRMTTEGGAA